MILLRILQVIGIAGLLACAHLAWESTPWGGEARAKTGVESSPAVIPSWKDVDPQSPYIHRLFAKKLDPSIHYYLFFGHKGGGSLFRPNNDNTVTLESMLDPRAQARQQRGAATAVQRPEPTAGLAVPARPAQPWPGCGREPAAGDRGAGATAAVRVRPAGPNGWACSDRRQRQAFGFFFIRGHLRLKTRHEIRTNA